MEVIVYGLAVFGIYQIFERFQAYRRKKYWKKNDIKDVENQKRFVTQEDLYKQKLMNKSEYRVFQVLENWISSHSEFGYRLFSQVSIGEYMKSSRSNSPAYSSINSKRVDFLIIDPYGEALLAIEYQGSGHNQNNARDRDEVKALAHKNAGIKLLEIFDGEDETGIKNKVNAEIGVNTA